MRNLYVYLCKGRLKVAQLLAGAVMSFGDTTRYGNIIQLCVYALMIGVFKLPTQPYALLAISISLIIMICTYARENANFGLKKTVYGLSCILAFVRKSILKKLYSAGN